jgi:hypothetical protein
MLNVIERPIGIGIFTNARMIKIATSIASSVIRAIFVRLELLVVMFSSVRVPSGYPSKLYFRGLLVSGASASGTDRCGWDHYTAL